jgi:hypothetical protein
VRQATVGSTLATLYARSATVLLRIDVERTGDVDFPSWDPVASGVPALVLQLNADQRQRRSEGYSSPVTHEAFCDDQDDLMIGCRVVETHVRQEGAVWSWLPSTEQVTYLVRGKQSVPGMPEPHGQVRLDLNQVTPTA